MPEFENETDRIRSVYSSYQSDGFYDNNWSPSNKGNQKISSERNRCIARSLRQPGLIPLRKMRILDVGCGNGNELARMLEFGADVSNLHGIDLLEWRIDEARNRFPEISFTCVNAEEIPYPVKYFDIVLLFTVFSSILDGAMRMNVASEVNRVLKENGIIVWYDIRYGNPRNRNVGGITRPEISRLFPHCSIDLQPVTLLPPLTRKLGPITSIAYPLLNTISVLRTHYFGLVSKII